MSRKKNAFRRVSINHEDLIFCKFHREIHIKLSKLPMDRFEEEAPVMIVYYAMTDGKPQAGTAITRLCGKEWIEDSLRYI